ncbi:unnamed protein product [Spirodela intermedia]|uniref:Uncharacterized protein n=1 Tax=Spirodela intermedia TaxID=51605 RepID=A0A7I8J5E7_SPIIN|nr:unnamed protein product [Spirodela intermedia]CAA6665289.1 unnamed protein product [Spirodela intermedia]
MDARIRAIVDAIHPAPRRLSSTSPEALGWLLSVPGASNTVLEALVPYSKTSLSQLLGKLTVTELHRSDYQLMYQSTT